MKKKGLILGIIIISIIVGVAASVSSSNVESYDIDMTRTHGSISTAMGSPILGDPDAPVTIVEFGDYQCHQCHNWFLDTKPMIMRDYIETGKVNLVFVDFAFLGRDSPKAAEATYCADDQNKYWEYHNELYKNWGGERTGWITRDSLSKFAEITQLNINEFNNCLDEQKYQGKVNKLYEFGNEIGINATPSFLVFNNENIIKIRGNQPLEVFLKTFNEL